MERNQNCRSVQDRGYCAKAKAGECPYRHPPQCKNNMTCFNSSCTFLHDNDQCRFASRCTNADCAYRHPKDRVKPQNDNRRHYNNNPEGVKREDNPNPRYPNTSPFSNLANLSQSTSSRGSKPLDRDAKVERSDRRNEAHTRDNRPKDRRDRVDRMDVDSVSSERERGNKGDANSSQGDRPAPRALSPLEELLSDRNRFNAIMGNARAISYVTRTLYDFDQLIKANARAVNKIKQRMANKLGQDDSKIREELNAASNLSKELFYQRRTITYTIYGIVKALKGPSIPANYHIVRELYRLKGHLPILARRFEISEALAKSQFVVLQAGSGSGKSTQLSQYLADMPQFATKKIISTHPRKSEVISLAEHVAFQYAGGNAKYSKVGGFVGYRTAGAKKISRWTRIEYIAENTLLHLLNPTEARREQYERALNECGAIIIDEAHERNMTTDVLLGVIKQLAANFPHLKVVISSDTLAEAALFAAYFGDCPMITVPDRVWPVKVYNKPVTGQEDAVVDNVLRCAVDVLKNTKREDGDILCFVTTQDEAERAQLGMQRHVDNDRFLRGKIRCYSLHEKSSPAELKELLVPAPFNMQKVVFATSIAETSVTIDRVRFVIDSGLSRDGVWDPKTMQTSVKLRPISKAASVQRKDLAGRSSSGVCFRLYSTDDFEVMRASPVPELFRSPLALISASLMSMGMDPFKFGWLEAPKPASLERAMKELALLNAVKGLPDGRKVLTQLGHLMVQLQQDPATVHMLYNACQRGLGQTACIIAGLMSVANGVFWRGGDLATRKASEAARAKFLSNKGDIVTLYRVYTAWVEQKNMKAAPNVAVNEDVGDIIEDAINNNIRASGDGEDMDMSDNEKDSSSDSDESGDGEVNTNEKHGMEGSDRMEVETVATDDSSLQLDDSSVMADEDDDAEEQKKAQSGAVRQWCKENFINNKPLIIATSMASDLRRSLMKHGIWNMHADQNTVPDDTAIQRLVLDALILNLAVRIREGTVRTVFSNTIAAITPISSLVLLHEPSPKYLVYNSIVNASSTYVVNITPLQKEWLQDFPGILDSVKDIEIEQVVISPVPSAILQTVMGKYNVNAEAMSKELGCTIEADMNKGALVAWCPTKSAAEIRAFLEAKVEQIRNKTALEVQEEAFVGNTRIVWGTGGEIVTLLRDDEFISVYVNNLPATITEEQLWTMFSADGSLRSCTLSQTKGHCQKDENKQSAHLVFKDPATAKKIFEELKQKKIDVAPGVVKKLMAVREIQASIQFSLALGESKSMAYLTFQSAVAANSVLASKLYRMKPIGQTVSDRNNKHGVPTIKDNLFKVEEESKFNAFKISAYLGNKSIDEFDVVEELKKRNLPLPINVVIKRLPTPEDEVDRLKGRVNTLEQDLLPYYIREDIVDRRIFWDEKRGRAGVTLYFHSEDCPAYQLVEEAMKDAVLEASLEMAALINMQPIRAEAKYTLSMAINTALWKKFKDQFERTFKARAKNVLVLSNEKVHSQVIFNFQSNDIVSLKQIRQDIDKILRCSVFRHPRKSLLWTSIGRKRLQELENLPIQWDRSLTIRIYGSEQEQKNVERRLSALIDELAELVIGEAFVVKRTVLDQLRRDVGKLKELTGVEEMRLFGSRVVASGTQEAVNRLRFQLAAALIVPKKATERTDDECPICIDTFDEPVTLQSCGHTFCKACLQGYFGQMALPIPLCCPLNCKPMIVKDLITHVQPDALEQVKQTALEKFVQQHVHEYTHCPKQGCPQFLRIPPVKPPADEKYDGGRVVTCDQCCASYCHSCSAFYGAVIERHADMTCEQQRVILRPSVNQFALHIQNELLPSSCPRCTRAFLDFNGCCAVTCECGANFCGLCLIDTQGDAHAHVANCPISPKPGSLFHSAEDIARCQSIVKRRKIVAYLKQIQVLEDRKGVLLRIQRDLADLKIQIAENDIL